MFELKVCRVSRLIAAGAALCLGLRPALCEAQTALEYKARFDSLVPQAKAARVALSEAMQTRRVTATQRTVRTGGLVIVADSSIADMVASAAEEIWPTLKETFGDDANRLALEPIVAARTAAGIRDGGDTVWVIGLGKTWTQTASLLNPRRTHTEVLAGLRALAPRTLHDSLDADLRDWFGTPLPAGRQSRDDLEAAFIELATSSVDASRGCLAGDLDACRQAVGFSDLADPIAEGFTAADRRAILSDNRRDYRLPATAADYDRCVRDRVDAACLSVLRAIDTDRLNSRLAFTRLRRSFAQLTLERGGEGAYARLRASTELPLEGRFERAGGMSADSLLAAWRSTVLAAQPDSPAPGFGAASTAIFWIVLSGALALRSSRWR